MAQTKNSQEAARRAILEDVFSFFQRTATYPIADDFRLDHESELKACDGLEWEGVLERRDGVYIFHLAPYIESAFWKHDEKIIDRLLPKLKDLYRAERSKAFPIEALQKGLPLGVKPLDLKRALIIMQRLDLIRGMTRVADTPKDEYSTYSVPERVLLFDNLRQVIDEARMNGHYQVTLDKKAATSNPFPHGLIAASPFSAQPPAGYGGYSPHPVIAKVSAKLFADGHYAQAVEEAFKAAIARVKTKLISMKHEPGDGGDGMMGIAFGSDKQEPRIRFNALSSREEKDEHRGIFFLFKGIVGIRNRKAHENVVLNDPQRAADYLHLASLLMRLLDVSDALMSPPPPKKRPAAKRPESA